MIFDEKLKDADTEEKLAAVDKKMKEMLKSCAKKKRAALVSPILTMNRKLGWKKRSKYLLYPPVFVAFVAVYLAWDPQYFLVRAATKKFVIATLPIDWKSLFNSECFIDNPYIAQDGVLPSLRPEDCQFCDQTTPDIRKNIDRTAFAEDLIQSRTVVVTDGISRWKSSIPVDEFKFNKFVKMHFTNAVFRRASSYCSPHIRVPSDPKAANSMPETFDYILKNWKDDTLHFSASWVNCNKQGYNLVRSYYDKAYFLPEMTEVARYTNHVLMSSRAMGNDKRIWTKLVSETADYLEGMWIGIIHGNMQIRMVPKPECMEACKVMKFTLKQGEILNFNTRYTSVYFRSENRHAVGVGVTYKF